MTALPKSIDGTLALLRGHDYVAERSLATALFLALKMERPLFLEGEAGVGKTEIAKVVACMLGRRLVRLQCYEGLDIASAVYEWNYAAQMIAIRVAEAEGAHDRQLALGGRIADPVIQAAPLERVVHLAGAVGCNDHDRRLVRLHRAKFRHRHLIVGQHLEQERLESLGGTV
ncbi:MAG TPA: MoxR family ATPase, partial [Burkholderiales bacterium]